MQETCNSEQGGHIHRGLAPKSVTLSKALFG